MVSALGDLSGPMDVEYVLLDRSTSIVVELLRIFSLEIWKGKFTIRKVTSGKKPTLLIERLCILRAGVRRCQDGTGAQKKHVRALSHMKNAR